MSSRVSRFWSTPAKTAALMGTFALSGVGYTASLLGYPATTPPLSDTSSPESRRAHTTYKGQLDRLVIDTAAPGLLPKEEWAGLAQRKRDFYSAMLLDQNLSETALVSLAPSFNAISDDEPAPSAPMASARTIAWRDECLVRAPITLPIHLRAEAVGLCMVTQDATSRKNAAQAWKWAAFSGLGTTGLLLLGYAASRRRTRSAQAKPGA